MLRPKVTKVYDGADWTIKRVKNRGVSDWTTSPVRLSAPLDPYAGVNWVAAEYIIGNTHMHSRQANTTSTTAEMFDLSYDAGVRSMAWSNYYDEEPSMPLNSYFGITAPADAVGLANSEQHRLSDTNLHYCPIGSTQERYGTYTVPVSVDNTWRSLFTEALQLMTWDDAGGITLNHPQWTNVHGGGMTEAELLQMLDFDKRVLGIEIYNHKTEYLPDPPSGWALDWWDSILSTGRRCWGFCVTDGYDERINPDPALGHSVLLIDENTDYKAAKAYRDGHFYGTMKADGTLRFLNISSDMTSVNVELNEPGEIKFYSEDGLEQTNTGVSTASYNVDSDQIFVRAEATNATGDRIFSQPTMYSLA